MRQPGAGGPSIETTRLVAIVVLCAPWIPLVVSSFLPPLGGSRVLLWPAVAAGILLPLTGALLYPGLLRAARGAPDRAARFGRFFAATLTPMALSEGAALLGAIAHYMSGSSWAITPLVTHVLLCVAVWPTRERYESAVEGTPGSA